MLCAIVQLSPELGKLVENVAKANALLETVSLQDVDLLVLPELAFSGSLLCPSIRIPRLIICIDRLQPPLFPRHYTLSRALIVRSHHGLGSYHRC